MDAMHERADDRLLTLLSVAPDTPLTIDHPVVLVRTVRYVRSAVNVVSTEDPLLPRGKHGFEMVTVQSTLVCI